LQELVYIDSAFIDSQEYAVQLDNRGYMYGDGLFETLRVYDGQCFALVKHLERYRRSMRELYIPITDTDIELMDLMNEMIAKSGIQSGVIYFQLTRGTAAPRQLHYQPRMLPHLSAIIRDIPVNTEWQEKGIMAAFADDLRWARCDINSTNMLGNVLAADQAHKRGYQAAILCKEDKTITEAADANVFIVRDGVLWTHPANNSILAGVTRSTIIDALAKKLDLAVIQKPFKQDFALASEEMFITNTYNEIVPVIKVEKTVIGDGKPGETTRMLQKAFKEFVVESLSGDYLGKPIR